MARCAGAFWRMPKAPVVALAIGLIMTLSGCVAPGTPVVTERSVTKVKGGTYVVRRETPYIPSPGALTWIINGWRRLTRSVRLYDLSRPAVAVDEQRPPTSANTNANKIAGTSQSSQRPAQSRSQTKPQAKPRTKTQVTQQAGANPEGRA